MGGGVRESYLFVLKHPKMEGDVISDHFLALFDMPNLNRFDILSISIFCKIALSISISIFSKITISISISIFLELPYRYRYFSELPYRYRYRYRYFQLLHIDIDIDIDIFQKCQYIDNRYSISIYRTGLAAVKMRAASQLQFQPPRLSRLRCLFPID